MQKVCSSVLFVVLALLLFGAAGAIGAAQVEAVANQQAPLGNLLLQSAGRTTSISSLTWNGSAFTRTKVWPGARVALDTRQALFTVADFTGDGLPDGAALGPGAPAAP